MSTLSLRRARLDDHAAAQPEARDPLSVGLAGPAPCPVMMLLLFVYAFGDSIGTGVGGAAAGRDVYLEYLTLVIVGHGGGAGFDVDFDRGLFDMTEGIIDRFRTMNISRSSFMTGHVRGASYRR